MFNFYILKYVRIARYFWPILVLFQITKPLNIPVRNVLAYINILSFDVVILSNTTIACWKSLMTNDEDSNRQPRATEVMEWFVNTLDISGHVVGDAFLRNAIHLAS